MSFLPRDPHRKPSLFEQLANDMTMGLISPVGLGADEHYQNDPVAWAVDRLGVRENTIRWSLNPGYEDHRWDGTVDPIATILESVAQNKDVGVESGTGTGKCVRGSSLAFTGRGLLRMDELVPRDAAAGDVYVSGDTVSGRDGPEPASGVYYDGRRKVYDVTTSQGYAIGGTAEHRVLVLRGGRLEWAYMPDVRPGDYVAIQRGMELWPSDYVTVDGVPVDEETGYLLGVLTGDGYVKDTAFVKLLSEDAAILESVRAGMIRMGATSVSSHVDPRAPSSTEITAYGAEARRRLADVGLGYHGAWDKVVPWTIMRSPRSVVAAFIRGLFDVDACADKRGNIEFTTVSAELARQVHTMLLNFGIVSRLSRRSAMYRYQGERHKSSTWRLVILGPNATRYFDAIGFALERKQDRRVALTHNANIDVVPGVGLVVKRLAAQAVKSGHPSPRRDGTVDSWAKGVRRPSMNCLRRFVDANMHLQTIPEYQLLAELVDTGYFFDHVTTVETDEDDVYDFVVPGTNSFNANGFVNHNTFIGAVTLLWFLACFRDALVVTTAPKEQQLTLHLWKEVQRLWPRFAEHFPKADLVKLQLRMDPVKPNLWTAVGFACGVGAAEQSATKAQGFHEEHMLIITEETPGIHPAVMKAFENTCTGDHNIRLAFGNPDHQLDPLHEFCTQPNVVHVRVSALDHPNVVCDNPSIVPGAVSRRSIDSRRAQYGEDSKIFRSRVRGICPAEAEEALIRLAWCRAAVLDPDVPEQREKRDRLLDGPDAMGVDVADSPTGDKGGIAYGTGAVLHHVKTQPVVNANEFGALVALQMDALNLDERYVGVDAIGVGAGAVNELKRLGRYVQAIQSAAKPIHIGGMTEQFYNLRSQMWWVLRLDLQHGRIALPDDPDLFEELTTPQWTIVNGKIKLESKKEIRKRIGRSTDKADPVVYWNFVRQHFAGATKGGRVITF